MTTNLRLKAEELFFVFSMNLAKEKDFIQFSQLKKRYSSYFQKIESFFESNIHQNFGTYAKKILHNNEALFTELFEKYIKDNNILHRLENEYLFTNSTNEEKIREIINEFNIFVFEIKNGNHSKKLSPKMVFYLVLFFGFNKNLFNKFSKLIQEIFAIVIDTTSITNDALYNKLQVIGKGLTDICYLSYKHIYNCVYEHLEKNEEKLILFYIKLIEFFVGFDNEYFIHKIDSIVEDENIFSDSKYEFGLKILQNKIDSLYKNNEQQLFNVFAHLFQRTKLTETIVTKILNNSKNNDFILNWIVQKINKDNQLQIEILLNKYPQSINHILSFFLRENNYNKIRDIFSFICSKLKKENNAETFKIIKSNLIKFAKTQRNPKLSFMIIICILYCKSNSFLESFNKITKMQFNGKIVDKNLDIHVMLSYLHTGLKKVILNQQNQLNTHLYTMINHLNNNSSINPYSLEIYNKQINRDTFKQYFGKDLTSIDITKINNFVKEQLFFYECIKSTETFDIKFININSFERNSFGEQFKNCFNNKLKKIFPFIMYINYNQNITETLIESIKYIQTENVKYTYELRGILFINNEEKRFYLYNRYNSFYWKSVNDQKNYILSNILQHNQGNLTFIYFRKMTKDNIFHQLFQRKDRIIIEQISSEEKNKLFTSLIWLIQNSVDHLTNKENFIYDSFALNIEQNYSLLIEKIGKDKLNYKGNIFMGLIKQKHNDKNKSSIQYESNTMFQGFHDNSRSQEICLNPEQLIEIIEKFFNNINYDEGKIKQIETHITYYCNNLFSIKKQYSKLISLIVSIILSKLNNDSTYYFLISFGNDTYQTQIKERFNNFNIQINIQNLINNMRTYFQETNKDDNYKRNGLECGMMVLLHELHNGNEEHKLKTFLGNFPFIFNKYYSMEFGVLLKYLEQTYKKLNINLYATLLETIISLSPIMQRNNNNREVTQVKLYENYLLTLLGREQEVDNIPDQIMAKKITYLLKIITEVNINKEKYIVPFLNLLRELRRREKDNFDKLIRKYLNVFMNERVCDEEMKFGIRYYMNYCKVERKRKKIERINLIKDSNQLNNMYIHYMFIFLNPKLKKIMLEINSVSEHNPIVKHYIQYRSGNEVEPPEIPQSLKIDRLQINNEINYIYNCFGGKTVISYFQKSDKDKIKQIDLGDILYVKQSYNEKIVETFTFFYKKYRFRGIVLRLPNNGREILIYNKYNKYFYSIQQKIWIYAISDLLKEAVSINIIYFSCEKEIDNNQEIFIKSNNTYNYSYIQQYFFHDIIWLMNNNIHQVCQNKSQIFTIFNLNDRAKYTQFEQCKDINESNKNKFISTPENSEMSQNFGLSL